MKTVMIVDHGERRPEDAVALLRAHGYAVEPAHPAAAFRNEPDPVRTGEPVDLQPLCRDIHLSPHAIMVVRASDGTVLDVNQAGAQLTGYSRDTMIGRNILGPVFFLNPEFWTRAFQRLDAEGEVRDLETRLLRNDGLVAFVLVSLRGVEIDGTPCHVITIRERAPGAFRGAMEGCEGFPDAALESLLAEDGDFNRDDVGRLIDFQALQDLMNSFFKVTRIGIGINDIKGNVQVATGWQDVCTRFHRVHPETLAKCLESDICLSREMGRGEALYKCRNGMWDMATPLIIGGRHIANIFLGQFFFEDEVPDYDFFRKQAEAYGFDVEEYLAAVDRVPRWSRELVRNVMEFYRKLAVMISRLSIGTIQFSQALAEQKRVSEELRQANLVVENSPVVLFRWRAEQGWPVDFVSANVTRFGYTREELLSGSVPFSSLVHPDDLERVTSEVVEYTSAGVDQFQQEYRILTKVGEVRRIDDRTVIERDTEGRVTHYQGIVIDTTERSQAEDALREREERLRSIFRAAPIGIGVVRDRVLLEVNHRLCEMTGYTREQMIGESARMLYPDREEFERVGRDKYLQIGEKGTGTVETRWQRKDDAVIDVLLSSTPVDTADLSKGVTFTALDITQRKRAEEALRESEEKFRMLAETTPTAIFLYQGEMIVYANPATERLFGYSNEELLRMRFWDWAHDDFCETVRMNGLAWQRQGAVPGRYESRFVTKNGEDRWLVVSAGPIEYRGAPAGVVSFLDITENKKSEELLRASLAEKVVLLKEVHHRVKNNLQIISSLLDLQSESMEDEDSGRFVRESRNRITSMALVHEKLYQSENYASINFAEYLDSLTRHLLSTLVKDPALITLTLDIGDFALGVDEAIPCGLIVNELVSNSLKHAFPPGGKGEISIRFRSEEDGWAALTVADTGPGLPPGLDFRNTATLGLQLVVLLVQQLRGTVEMGEKGAVFTIRFKTAAR
jgi:PAS domain S-box-containing protein